jgi:hypothetical protein
VSCDGCAACAGCAVIIDPHAIATPATAIVNFRIAFSPRQVMRHMTVRRSSRAGWLI